MGRVLSPSSVLLCESLPGRLRLLVGLIAFAMLSGLSLAVEASVTIRYVDHLPAEPGSAWDGVDGGAYVGVVGSGFGYSTLRSALAAMEVGDKIYLRGGTYYGRTVLPAKNGSSWEEGCYNLITSYPGEWAVLDGQNNLRGDDGQGSNSWLSVLGFNMSRAYWKFERLEIRNGRSADASATSGSSRGFHADGGPFIFRFCYIHSNHCDYAGNIPAGISGHSWHDSVVEFCFFKDNGSLTSMHWNASAITMFSDYNSANIVKDGYSGDAGTRRNVFRYNLFQGGSGGMFETKSPQFFTGKNVGSSGYVDTFKTYGDRVHHNIFRDLGAQAIEAAQDFIQIHNNIVDGCSTGLLFNFASAQTAALYKTMACNNTIRNVSGAAIAATQSNGYPDPSLRIEPMIHGFLYNNIIDACTNSDTWNKEEITLHVYGDGFVQDEYKIDRCYSYRPVSHSNDPTGRKMICWKDRYTRYTIEEFKALRPGVELWMNDYDANNELYQGTTGSAQYKTRGEHVLSGSTTIANGGIGGAHPYLDGVVMPSYLGATNPSDNAWVDGVLGLADLSNLINGGPGDPSWIEGGSGNHAPALTPVGIRSIPAGEQLQFTVEATDADGDGLQFSATGGSK